MSEYVDPRPLFEAHIAKHLNDLPAELDPFILEIGGILEQQRRRRMAGVQRVAELLQDRPAELLQELGSIESDHGRLPQAINTAVTLAARASLDPVDARTIAIVTGESALHRALSAVGSYLAELRDASWWDRPSAFVAPSQDELIAHRREKLERFDFENNPARAAEKQNRDAALVRSADIGETLPDLNRRIDNWREVPPGDAHGLLLKEDKLTAMMEEKHDLESELRTMRGDQAATSDHGDVPVRQDDPSWSEDMHSTRYSIVQFNEPRVLDDWCKVIRECAQEFVDNHKCTPT